MCSSVLLSQDKFLNFAGTVARQRISEGDLLRPLKPCQVAIALPVQHIE